MLAYQFGYICLGFWRFRLPLIRTIGSRRLRRFNNIGLGLRYFAVKFFAEKLGSQ